MSSDSGSNKTSAQFHSLKGSAKEALGNITGVDKLQRSGQEEHQRAQAEMDAARAKGHAEGTAERIGGNKDAALGTLTGDSAQREQGNVRREQGRTQQQANRNV